ncbi:MAG: hypothetical protein ACLTXL_06410 [Clostridia bacterium]
MLASLLSARVNFPSFGKSPFGAVDFRLILRDFPAGSVYFLIELHIGFAAVQLIAVFWAVRAAFS